MTRKHAILIAVFALIGLAYAQRSPRSTKQPDQEIHIPPGKENLPAEQVFRNIQMLRGKPASRLPELMKSFNTQLGVQCTYCHVAGAWEREDPAPKGTARRMYGMVADISDKYFEGTNEVTCSMCHRGNPKPSNGATEISAGLAKMPGERRKLIESINPGPDKTAPAQQAFQNIRVLTDTPAGRIAPTMAAFTVALTVDCSHCHVADQYDDDDKPEKETTREMIRLVKDINHQLFDDKPMVGCWTCHRGSSNPETAPTSSNPNPEPSFFGSGSGQGS